MIMWKTYSVRNCEVILMWKETTPQELTAIEVTKEIRLWVNDQLDAKLRYIKSVPLQAWSGPEVSRKLRFPDFMKTAQDGGKVANLTHRPPLPQEILLVLISVRS